MHVCLLFFLHISKIYQFFSSKYCKNNYKCSKIKIHLKNSFYFLIEKYILTAQAQSILLNMKFTYITFEESRIFMDIKFKTSL